MVTLLLAGSVAIVPDTVLPDTLGVGHAAAPVVLVQVAAMLLTPVGTGSLNVVPLAASGPALLTTRVYTTAPPAVVFDVPVLIIDTLATAVAGVMLVTTGPPLVLVSLLARLGSVMPAGGVTLAVLETLPLAGAVPTTVMVTLPPAGKAGMVALTLLPAAIDAGQVAPAVALPHVALTPVMLAGTLSVTIAPLAAPGPALLTVRV
jgi:hypothetical protein